MIKFILSILAPILFIANYWVCEWLYPMSGSDWNDFIPMDKLCHNFWAVTILLYAVISLLRTTIHLTVFFQYVTICFSLFDVWARLTGMCDMIPFWYVLSLLLSLIISGVIYGISRRNKLAK